MLPAKKMLFVSAFVQLASFSCAKESNSAFSPVDLSSTTYGKKLNAFMLSQGVSAANCSVDTGISCRFWGCDSSMGPTDCVGGFMSADCTCQRGYCALNGSCYQPPRPTKFHETCNLDTGATCRIIGCDSGNGPQDCVGGFMQGKCLCQKGYCAYNGKCVIASKCDNLTPEDCSDAGCSSEHGDAECVKGKCVCKKDACAVDGKCAYRCRKDTGAACDGSDCGANAECQDGRCMCGQHYCSFGGTCEKGGNVTVEELVTSVMAGITEPQRRQEDLNPLSTLASLKPPKTGDPIVLAISMMMLCVAVVGRAFHQRNEPPLGAPLLEAA